MTNPARPVSSGGIPGRRIVIDLSVTIDTADVLRALVAVDDPHNAQRIANEVADQVVLPNLAKYPGASGKKMKWKSEKQRRFVIAAIRLGDIQVPYHRSGNLSAAYQKQPIADGLALVSSAPYAAYVRGGGPDQAEYHKGNWDTHEAIAQQSEADAALVATATLVEIIGDAGP